MNRVLFVILRMSSFCLPSNGQIQEIYEDGETLDCPVGTLIGGRGDTMIEYRFVFGRYPDEKIRSSIFSFGDG